MGGNVLMQSSIVRSSINGDFEIMNIKIADWLNMYLSSCESVVTNKDGNEELKITLGLPAAICAEMARLVTQEMELNIVDTTSQTEVEDEKAKKIEAEAIEHTRASFITFALNSFKKKIPVFTEYACAGGGVVFKPYVTNDDKIAIDCSLADEFVPLEFNSEGKITSCAFSEDKTVGKKYYHRIETHKFNNGTYVVTNEVYRSYVKDTLGTKCSLTEVPEWSELAPEVTLENVPGPLFAYFRIPIGNCIDTTSPLGMSIFGRAESLIFQADKQWGNYLWEFDATQAQIEVTKGTFDEDENGDPIIPQGKERLYIVSNLECDEDSNNFKIYCPTIREEPISKGLNNILKKIEFNVGLAYATISDPQQIEKTAEEIKTSRQRSYSTVHQIQSALEDAIVDLAQAIDTYATLYKLAPKGGYQVKIHWDDSILIDSEKERARDKDDVRSGIMQKWEYRVKWYNESEEEAKQKCGADFNANPFNLKEE